MYTDAPVIHVIQDNYRIHKSQITRRAPAGFGGRIRLHFLPPYCPNENKIERLWQDLHAGLTRNHRCRTMAQLMQHVYRFLKRREHRAARFSLWSGPTPRVGHRHACAPRRGGRKGAA